MDYKKINKILKELRFLHEVKADTLKKVEVDVIVLCHDNHRSLKFNNKRYSPLTDSIIDDLRDKGSTVISYGLPYSILTGDDSYSSPLSLNREFVRARINQFISEKLYGWMVKNIGRMAVINFWISLIKNHKPKMVICVQPSEDLCIAGKIMNVEIVDVQHGIINFNSYYDSREGSVFGMAGTPDKVYCWDRHSKDRVIKQWGSIEAIVFGHPFISTLKKNNKVFIGIEDSEKIKRLKKLDSVLITLQYDRSNLDVIKFPMHVKEAIMNCLNRGIVFAVKIHPVQALFLGEIRVNEKLKLIFGKALCDIVINVTSIPLAILFDSVKFHITEYSASAIEASVAGVKTGLWGKEKDVADMFKPYIDDGIIRILEQDAHIMSSQIIDEISTYE